MEILLNNNEKINDILNVIMNSKDSNQIKKIYLFGSYAYGEPNINSDIDVFIIVDNYCDYNKFAINTMTSLMKNNIFYCDLFARSEKCFERGIIENYNGIENIIKNDGRLLYARK